LFQRVESLEGVESLIGHPTGMSRTSGRGTALAVPENLARLSEDIKGVDHLLGYMDGALDRVSDNCDTCIAIS
jgi:cystathionine beta-lyase/cystathionine gamma-synthase